jgi:uncharacterized membrane protein
MFLPLHVAAGALAIMAGFVALFSRKGAAVHRRSGVVFAAAMLTMSVSGAMLAIGRLGVEVNLPAGLVTAYLVVTAFLTVQPPSDRIRALERAAMVAAFVLAALAVGLGVSALSRGYAGFGVPAIMFGLIALGAGAGDRRMLRAGRALQGGPRLKRHLWRMCTALFIASASFFLGPARRVPEPLRLPPFKMIPFVALAALAFWMWRLRDRRKPKTAIAIPASEGI